MGLPVGGGEISILLSRRALILALSGTKKRTIGGTLGGRALAATTADADAVDNVALLGLVAETAGLVETRRAGSAVDDVQLTVLY